MMFIEAPTMVLSWWWREASRKSFTISVASLVVLLLISLARKRSKASSPPLPPGPRGLPLVGYLPFLGSELHRTFEDMAGAYGPIFRVQLGSKSIVVVSSPSIVKEIVRGHDVVFANRVPTVALSIVTYGGLDIAFSKHGRDWQKMRKIFASDMLSGANLSASYRLRRRQVKRTIKEAHERAGRVVDIGVLALATVSSSVTSMVWGSSSLKPAGKGDGPDAEFRDLLGELMVLLGAPNVSDVFPCLARLDLQGIQSRTRTIFSQIEEILDSAIRHYNDGDNDGQENFLGHLLKLTKNEDASTSLTLLQVKLLLLDIVIGGTDTTATVIEWAMAEILQHPEVMRKVQGELAEIVGLDSLVEEAHLPELSYLSAVVKETLRLHPPLPFLFPHFPSESTTIGGYTIPEGTQVFLNAWAIHRDPNLWGEAPLEFRPERFLKGSSAENCDYLGKDLRFLPFGSGRRMCAGIPLAERTLKHTLASLLHSFEWSLPNGASGVDLSEKYGISMKKLKPLEAVPTPRLSSSELYSLEE